MYFLKRVACLFGLFVVLLSGIRLLGRASPNIVAQILDPVSCSLPCWHNIQPGATKIQDVQAILQADNSVSDIHQDQTIDPSSGVNYDKVCWNFSAHADWQGCAVKYVNSGDDFVNRITFSLPLNTFMLGDAIATFGQPAYGLPCIPQRNTLTNTVESIGASGFDHNVNLIMPHGSAFPNTLNPYMSVSAINYIGSYGSATYPPLWQGFTFDRFGCF